MMQIMPRISEERRERQRERITDAMLAAIQEEGLASASMSSVIERSGLSAGAIYGYFSGREEIVLSVAHRIVRGRAEILSTLASRCPVPSPTRALRALLETLPEESLRGGAILQIWGQAATQEPLREASLAVVDALMGNIDTYLRAWFAQEGRSDPAADARRATPALMALAQGYLVQSALLPDRTVDAFVEGVGVLLGE